MSKELTFVFGKDSVGNYPQYEMRNVLIMGRTGSGVGAMLQNILDTLVLRYSPEELHISVYNGNRPNLLTDSRLSEVPHYALRANTTTMPLVTLIHNLEEKSIARRANQVKYADVIILDNTEDEYLRLSDVGKNAFRSLISSGPTLGMYFVVTDHTETYLQELNCHFDRHVVLRPTGDTVTGLLAKRGVDANSLPKYGRAVVVDKWSSAQVLDVPFYDRAHKRKIVNKEILPNGYLFNDDALGYFAALNGITTD